MPDEPQWRSEDTVRLSYILAEHGVDLMDVSSGGNTAIQNINKSNIGMATAYQAHFAEAVKKGGAKFLVSAVGSIRTGTVAEEVLQKGQADVIFVGRAFLTDPNLVWTWAQEMGVEVQLPTQIRWTMMGRGKQTKQLSTANNLTRHKFEEVDESGNPIITGFPKL